MKTWGYCRISKNKQSIARQVRNISRLYPDAEIIEEAFTGTKIQGRKELDKMLKKVKSGDTIVFDSVSRMSRNAEEGMALYEELFRKNINLIFLKEPLINTDVYRRAISQQLNMTGGIVDSILKGINEYMILLAREQILIAFLQSEKEVADLHDRVREGLVTAKLNGKQIGRASGTKVTTKKSVLAKAEIQKKARDFGGTYTDKDLIKVLGIARNTYYRYKKELLQEQEQI